MTQQALPDLVLSASSLLLVVYVAANLTRGDTEQAELWLDEYAPHWREPERPSVSILELEENKDD